MQMNSNLHLIKWNNLNFNDILRDSSKGIILYLYWYWLTGIDIVIILKGIIFLRSGIRSNILRVVNILTI